MGEWPREGCEMGDVIYRSEVRIERVKGPVRKAYLPSEPELVTFGVHGAVADHYKVSPDAYEPRATLAHGFYRDRCPVYRSLRAAIAITTELVFEPCPGSLAVQVAAAQAAG